MGRGRWGILTPTEIVLVVDTSTRHNVNMEIRGRNSLCESAWEILGLAMGDYHEVVVRTEDPPRRWLGTIERYNGDLGGAFGGVKEFL